MNRISRRRTLIFGFGYLGRRVADQLMADRSGRSSEDFGRIFVTTRSRQKARRLSGFSKNRGGIISSVLADWNDTRTLRDLPEVDQIVVSVAFDPRGGVDRFESQVGGLTRLLEATSPDSRLVYISTTGVYHQRGGVWVDETSPARARRAGARAHRMAEAQLHKHRPGGNWSVLRLAGIYGPGRVPRADDVMAARPVASRPDGHLNLIHVNDAAAAVVAAWEESGERLYNVSDDRPRPRREFYAEIAKLTGSPPPRFIDADPASARAIRSDSDKRVCNRRLRRDLLPKMRFPSFREGLRDCFGPLAAGVELRSAPRGID